MSVEVTTYEAELADPDVLSVEQAAQLLRDAPWRRLVALGDSIVAGVREATEGYRDLGWIDRIGEALAQVQPDFALLNVARRDVLAAVVRDEQLPRALEFGPDLAIVCCGGNDALRPDFSEAAFAGTCRAIVRPLQAAGAEVALSGMMDICASGVIPDRYRAPLGERLGRLDRITRELADELGCAFFDLHAHPRSADDGIYSSDRLHANAVGHGIAAATAIRTLGELSSRAG